MALKAAEATYYEGLDHINTVIRGLSERSTFRKGLEDELTRSVMQDKLGYMRGSDKSIDFLRTSRRLGDIPPDNLPDMSGGHTSPGQCPADNFPCLASLLIPSLEF